MPRPGGAPGPRPRPPPVPLGDPVSLPSCSLHPCVFHKFVLPSSVGSFCVLRFGVKG